MADTLFDDGRRQVGQKITQQLAGAGHAVVELVADQTADVDGRVADRLGQEAHVIAPPGGGGKLFGERRDHGGDHRAQVGHRAGGL